MTLANNLELHLGGGVSLPAGIVLSKAGAASFLSATIYVGTAGTGSSSNISGTINCTNEVQVIGGTGDDSLIVFLKTLSLPAMQGLKFDGGAGAGSDSLAYVGTDASEVIAIYDGPTGTIAHTTDVRVYNAAAPGSDVKIQYTGLELLALNGLGGNNDVTFYMAPGPMSMLVQVGGGSGGTNGFRVIGSTGDDQIVVGDYNAANKHPTSYSYTYTLDNGATYQTVNASQCFQIIDIAILQLFGDAGNDLMVNNKPGLASLLYGGDGNDTIVGNNGADVIFGGRGVDKMWGGVGDDFIFADEDFEYYKPGYVATGAAPNPAIGYETPKTVSPLVYDDGDFMDGGAGTNRIVSHGVDTIRLGSYILFHGGTIDVYSWLTGNLGDSMSTAYVTQYLQLAATSIVCQPFPISPI
jgi:Ca2+-binding RTX toxin-like protein